MKLYNCAGYLVRVAVKDMLTWIFLSEDLLQLVRVHNWDDFGLSSEIFLEDVMKLWIEKQRKEETDEERAWREAGTIIQVHLRRYQQLTYSLLYLYRHETGEQTNQLINYLDPVLNSPATADSIRL